MDPNRQESLKPVVDVLKKSRRAGMVYLSPDGKKMGAAYSWPWPDPGGERLDVLGLVVKQLEVVLGRWQLWYVEEGTPAKRAFSWPWPEEAGLFCPMPGQSFEAWPGWAFREEAEAQPEAEPVVVQTRLRVEQSGELRIVREVPEGEGASEDCAEDIVRVIAAADHRFSVPQLCEEMSRRNLCWGANLVASACQRLREAGRLTTGRDAKGKGLGLPQWGGEE